jgi:hypothetical protein
MIETWLYGYDPETKNSQWRGDIAGRRTANIPSVNIRLKISPSIFLDQHVILPIDDLPKGQANNAGIAYPCWCN